MTTEHGKDLHAPPAPAVGRVDLRQAAIAVLRATDARIDAGNGKGHPGEPHDHVLGDLEGREHLVCDTVRDCAGCGGAQYGSEDALNVSIAALRLALGEDPMPYERYRPETIADVVAALTETPR